MSSILDNRWLNFIVQYNSYPYPYDLILFLYICIVFDCIYLFMWVLIQCLINSFNMTNLTFVIFYLHIIFTVVFIVIIISKKFITRNDSNE